MPLSKKMLMISFYRILRNKNTSGNVQTSPTPPILNNLLRALVLSFASESDVLIPNFKRKRHRVERILSSEKDKPHMMDQKIIDKQNRG